MKYCYEFETEWTLRYTLDIFHVVEPFLSASLAGGSWERSYFFRG